MTRITAAKQLESGLFVESDSAGPHVHNQIGNDYAQWRPPMDRGTFSYQYNLHRCSIVVATNPWNRLDYMWRVIGKDGETTANNSGGINPAYYVDQDGFDHRFSIWQYRYRTVQSTSGVYGRSYWGITDTGGNVLNSNDGVESTNPYWRSSTGLAETGEGAWVLFVGHVYKAGSGTPGKHPDSGVYDTSGTKIFDSNIDWVAQEATRWRYRVFQYRARYTGCYTHYYRPRMDTLDGNAPTIADLVAGSESGDVLAQPPRIYPDGTWSHGGFDETALNVSMSPTTLGSTGLIEV